MSGITLAQAQANLDALMQMQLSSMLSMSMGGRTYSFRSLDELNKAIIFWNNMVTQKTRIAAGGTRHDVVLADFRGNQ